MTSFFVDKIRFVCIKMVVVNISSNKYLYTIGKHKNPFT